MKFLKCVVQESDLDMSVALSTAEDGHGLLLGGGFSGLGGGDVRRGS